MFAKYHKAIVAAVGAAVLGLGIALGVDSQVYTVVVAVATALGVYAAPNA